MKRVNPVVNAAFCAAHTSLGLSLLLPECDLVEELTEVLVAQCDLLLCLMEGEEICPIKLGDLVEQLIVLQEQIETLRPRVGYEEES